MTDVKESFKVLSKIWGNREGYVFMPWINGDATRENRKASYHEGKAFEWPKEKNEILAHMGKHIDDDLYFCPNLFLMKRRTTEFAAEEKALWADLDEKNPETVDHDLRPTMAWESSPGRYQAIWLLSEEAILASEVGGLGQRLTYYLGADKSGWDSTQLLRPPGWRNHKPDYREQYGEAPQGKLLWGVGPRYTPAEIDDAIPALTAEEVGSFIGDILEEEIESVSRSKVLARVRAKLPVKVKRLLDAREAEGDRSDVLFFLEMSLAEVGCTLSEIVAIVRPTVWNKFAGRNDELKRLQIEASKAIEKAKRQSEEDEESDFEVDDFKAPTNLWDLVADIKEPNWLIDQVWNQKAIGIIAGGPKSMKSFFSLDMAISIATGEPFLGEFKVRNPGPVLWVQEEDSLPEIRRRLSLITQGRESLMKYHPGGYLDMVDGKLIWGPGSKAPIDAVVRQGLMLSDPTTMEWLDEQLSKKEYRALFLDPLMQLHDANETQYGELMVRFLKPLRDIAYKYGITLLLVHHTKKSEGMTGRQGSRLLGSTAVHAWTEDLLVLDKNEKNGVIKMFRESKSAGEEDFTFQSNFQPFGRTLGGRQKRAHVWQVKRISKGGREPEVINKEDNKEGKNVTHATLLEMGSGPFGASAIAEHSGLKVNTVRVQLTSLKNEGFVKNVSRGLWQLVDGELKQ